MSDHFSGPRAIAGPAGDICDLYAFPSPERPGRLALVMTVLPGATASDVFSDAIVCRFRLRPTAIEGGGGRRRRVRPAALGWGCAGGSTAMTMAARAAHLGDVGDSAPEHREPPLGSPQVHVPMAAFARPPQAHRPARLRRHPRRRVLLPARHPRLAV